MKKYLFAVFCFLLSMQAHAGIVIGGTRVVYSGEKKEASVLISNPGKSNVYLVQSWIDSGDKQNKAPFIITPPLFRINAGEENILRIVRAGGDLPQDRESLFWLNVKSIPAIDDSQVQKNSLQIVVKSRLKLFYRPDRLAGQQNIAYKQLSFTHSGNKLTISNPTPFYVTLYSLKVDGREIKDADLVPPKGNVSYTLPSTQASNVAWQAISDFGSITPAENNKVGG